MPNFSGNWKIIRSENFEDLLKVLGVNVMLRKIAVAAASKPAVEIKQEGDTFYIKTSTTVRTTEIHFKIGEEFEEQTVDGRPCKVSPSGSWCHGATQRAIFQSFPGFSAPLPVENVPFAAAGPAHVACLLQSLVKWESENKMVCEQRLLKGEGPKTSWTRELTNDGELVLVRQASCQPSARPGPRSGVF
uniref:Cellular retinoic acid binding protein 2 n=1 Tax=Ailuropoda melanoleuca TaxID=9646 RepID=A0A7N5JIS7_AILME